MTRQILVGGIPIGGGAPVVIQSMLNTPTTDVESSLKQIRQLAAAGCQIARLAVPNMEGARGFAEICKERGISPQIQGQTEIPEQAAEPVSRFSLSACSA